MIQIQIDTTIPWRKAIAQRYWALTPDGDFQEEVAAIAADHGFTRGQVLAVARSASTVTSTVHCCVRCGTPKRFTCRKAFSEMRRQAVYVCEACTPPSPGDGVDASSDVRTRPDVQQETEEPRGPDASPLQ